MNLFTNLRIIDFVTGFVGSAHDSAVFKHSAVMKWPDWFFEGEEFMWADSAYTLHPRVIPVHKRPAADIQKNHLFDTAVAHIRIRSEHCMGALKGRWQSLCGLRISINRKRHHGDACNWIRMCIILHNLVIDIEGDEWAKYYWEMVPPEPTNQHPEAPVINAEGDATTSELGDLKRRKLVDAYFAHWTAAHQRWDAAMERE